MVVSINKIRNDKIIKNSSEVLKNLSQLKECGIYEINDDMTIGKKLETEEVENV